MSNKATRLSLIWVGFLLTIAVGAFLAFFSYSVINECRALSFRSTQGVVDSMSQGVNPYTAHGGGGCFITIAYHYNVAGRRYKGQRLTYVEISSESWTSDMARRLPAGSHPTVFYNPNDPSEAVLIRGIQSDDLFLALLLMPLMLIVLTVWSAVIRSFRKKAGSAGNEILNECVAMRIRPASWYAVRAAAAGLGVSAVAAFFIFAFATGGHPTLPTAEAAWGGVLTTTFVAGAAAGACVKAGVSLRMPKQLRVIRGYSEQPGALPVGIGFVLFGLCAGVPTWWNAWNAFHQSHPSEAPWVSLMIPCMLTLFFLIGLVCLVDALGPRTVAHTGVVARRHTSRSQQDYRVVEKADQIKFILPRSPIPLHHIAGGYLFAAPFILMGSYLAIAMYRPDWLGTANHPTGSSIDKLVVTLVPVLLLFIGSYVALAVTMAWLGRIEVRCSNAGLESRRLFGPIRFRSLREWKSVRQLAVKIPPGAQPEKKADVTHNHDAEREFMALYACCSGREPLVLATQFPRSMLLRLAKDVIRFAPRFSGRRDALSSGARPMVTVELRPRTVQSAKTPPVRYSRLVASEIPRGGVRITMRRNWPVAMACGAVLALILAAFVTVGTDHAAWLHSIIALPQKHHRFGYIACVFMTVPFVFFLIGALTMRVFDADASSLSRMIEGPFGRRLERWKRDDIAGLDVTTRTFSRPKGGGSYTVYAMEVRRNTGRPVELVRKLKNAELEWMRELLSAALRIPRLEPDAAGDASASVTSL